MSNQGQVSTTKRIAKCPACGGQVEFRLGTSLVTVCEYCQSAVARMDRKVEDHGKVADLAATGSPLSLGTKGKWDGKTLRLLGRVQYQHAAGGVWDEWYFALSNRKWGWLAEAQGRFYLTFEQDVPAGLQLPDLAKLRAGEQVQIGGWGYFTVNEVGTAQFLAAEGELPFDPSVTSAHRTADLSNETGTFLTLDYSGATPQVFLGKAVSLDDLGIAGTARESVEISLASAQLNCPQCGGVLPLYAPDQAQRVTCPSCRAYYDIDGTKLEYLETLKKPDPPLQIPLGTKGQFQGVEWTVIGYVRRFVMFDKRYFWSEYLLYHPREGYRWLVRSDGHWSFVREVSPGEVQQYPQRKFARWQGKKFKLFQSTMLHVKSVYGEFYWKLQERDTVHGRDYIRPPFMLSVETTDPELDGNTGSEVNVSLGEYVPAAEIEQAFGVKKSNGTWQIAPNQPLPIPNTLYLWWLASLTVLTLTWLGMSNRPNGVDGALTFWAFVFVSIMPICTCTYAYSFETRRWKDSEYNPYQNSE